MKRRKAYLLVIPTKVPNSSNVSKDTPACSTRIFTLSKSPLFTAEKSRPPHNRIRLISSIDAKDVDLHTRECNQVASLSLNRENVKARSLVKREPPKSVLEATNRTRFVDVHTNMRNRVPYFLQL